LIMFVSGVFIRLTLKLIARSQSLTLLIDETVTLLLDLEPFLL